MDPPTSTLMNTSPFNLSEIWPIPINGVAGDLTGTGLELRRGPFGPDLGRFVEPVQNREVSGNEGVGPERSGGSARKRRENSSSVVAEDNSAKGVCNGMSDSDAKRLKSSGPGDDNPNPKADGEENSGKGAEQKDKPSAEPQKDYIHVRARRGQATDSHSLAERARREKISERMRILQDLVPGCNKVIGKALVLDEIINYIQSLQRQVEFLSMKLEAVNSRVTPTIEGFPAKDFDTGKHSFAAFYKLQGAAISSEFGPQAFDPSAVVYGSQAAREYGRGSSPEWLHMQVGGGFERQT